MKEIMIGIGWYKFEQWEKLKEVSLDKDELEDTYNEWKQNAQKTILDLELQGIFARRIVVEVNELIKWCKENNRYVTGETRTAFITYKLKKECEDNK